MSDNIVYGVLPEGAQKYKETKIFTTATIPSGFRRQHSTKAKVWGKICSVQGAMTLSVFDPMREDIPMWSASRKVVRYLS